MTQSSTSSVRRMYRFTDLTQLLTTANAGTVFSSDQFIRVVLFFILGKKKHSASGGSSFE